MIWKTWTLLFNVLEGNRPGDEKQICEADQGKYTEAIHNVFDLSPKSSVNSVLA